MVKLVSVIFSFVVGYSPLLALAEERNLMKTKPMMKIYNKKGYSSGSSTRMKYNIDPSTWYIGFWQGVDPLDGAEIQREFLPVGGGMDGINNFTITGRIEFSQLCGGRPPNGGSGGAPPEGPPAITDKQVPAQINGYAQVNLTTNVLEAFPALTCFGDITPLARAPAAYVPYSQDIVMEVPTFRADFPIYLHRLSPYYTPLHDK